MISRFLCGRFEGTTKAINRKSYRDDVGVAQGELIGGARGSAGEEAGDGIDNFSYRRVHFLSQLQEFLPTRNKSYALNLSFFYF